MEVPRSPATRCYRGAAGALFYSARSPILRDLNTMLKTIVAAAALFSS